MLNVRLHVVLAFALVWLVSASPGRAATLVAAPASGAKPSSAAPVSRCAKTSEKWIRTGEALQEKGQNAEAGDAYRKGLECLSQTKQKADEGASAAILSAGAHWLAFEQDLDVIHLQAAMDALSLWLTLTGPQSRAPMLLDVQQRFSRLRAVRDPLEEANTAMSAGDTKKAVGHYGEAVDAMASQGYEWPLEARIVVRASTGCVAAYDRGEKTVRHVETQRPGLEAVRALLVKWKGKRPTDDGSEQGPAVDQALAEVEARLAEAKQVVADAAEAERIAAEKAADDKAAAEEVERIAAERAADERERKAEIARKKRSLAIGLLSGGVVAMGAGAGLVGDGIAGNREFEKVDKVQQDIAAMNEAQDIEQDPDENSYDYEGFLDDDEEKIAENRSRTLGMTIGGSVLIAGGLAMTVYGIVKLVQGRESRGGKQRARLRPGPFLVNVEF